MSTTRVSRFAVPIAAGLACFACATTTPQEVTDARVEYETARQDPKIAQYASVELYDAQQAVERMERAVKRDNDADFAQLAYLAHRRIEIAREAAAAGEAQARLEELGQRRDEVRVDAAKARAQASEEDAEEARAVAASALERARQLEADLNAKETERGLVLTMNEDVLFAFDRADLQPGAAQSLGEVARFLNEYPDQRIAVEGHTDSVGSETYNEELSRRRADAVASFLRTHGVERGRLEVAGFGESMPVSPNDTEAGRQMNRRVEIILAKPPTAGVSAPPPGRASVR
jgi:outer membrane protein OmpA-like peptidoglycan-associated protein